MKTIIRSGDADEPRPEPERTESEKIAQYRIDYRAALKSVADVVAAKATRGGGWQ